MKDNLGRHITWVWLAWQTRNYQLAASIFLSAINRMDEAFCREDEAIA
jgi:hypothetical protein